MLNHAFVYICAFFYIVLFPVLTHAINPADDCACPELTCNSCESQTGVQFYSDSCGAGKSRMKSCARPQCAPLDPMPAQCVAEQKAKEKAKDKTTIQREVASEMPKSLIAAKDLRGPLAARVAELKGSVFVTAPTGEKTKVQAGVRLYQNDQIETADDSSARLEFLNSKKVNEKNEVMLMEKTTMRISEFSQSKLSEKTVLDLLDGKIRNRVREKLKDPKSAYLVRTKTAVAGVRGTDFVMSYVQDQKLTATVETLEGEVVLGDPQGKQAAAIREGESASFVVALSDKNKVYSDAELEDMSVKGVLSPIYKMTANEVENLKQLTDARYAAERAKRAEAERLICREPEAELNQCSWECKGNPKGAANCRTDLPDVQCVRRRCNASGQWMDEQRLPASFFEACPKKGLRVGPCDY